MRSLTLTIPVLTWWLGCGSDRMLAQSAPPPAESTLGVLPAQANVAAALARSQCLILPVEPANDRLQGPHGDSLVSTHCEVIAY